MAYRIRKDTGKMSLAKFRVALKRRGMNAVKSEQGKPETWVGETLFGTWTVVMHNNGTCDVDFVASNNRRTGMPVSFEGHGAGKGLLYADALSKIT